MKRLTIIALCGLAVVAAGCGGGSSARLSKTDYQAKLNAISAQAKSDQQAVNQAAATAKTIAGLQDVLRKYAAAGDRFGDELGKLNPPTEAASANAALAKGEHDNADEIRSFIPKLNKYRTAQDALTFLEHVGVQKGATEVQTALSQLKALGYSVGV